MTAFKRYLPNAVSAFWLVTMAAVWLAFAPVRAGGMASYVIIIGNSMEPGFHIGDLIITHEQSMYQVGDAVVYRNRELGSFVFHRIIGEEEGRFSLQGDNNSWVDTYQPLQEEIIGKLWLHIPKGGRVIQAIRQPLAMALIAAALGVLLALGFFSGKTRGRKQMNKHWFALLKQRLQGALRPAVKKSPPVQEGAWLESVFFIIGLVAFSSLILGIVSFSRPATRSVRQDIGYDQLGFFAYTTSAPSTVYDASAIKSGDPIFPSLTCAVDMTFQYTLVAMQAEGLGGTYQLAASVSEPVSGWQRTIALQEKSTFEGSAFGTTARLDFCKIEELIRSMEQQTEFRPGAYLLTISPNIEINGEIAGHSLNETFNPPLVFRYDRLHFYLLKGEDLNENVLNISVHGSLKEERLEANTLRILGRDFAVPSLRILAVLGLVISLGGLGYFGWKAAYLAHHEPAQLAQIRYGSQMIEVQNAALPLAKSVIDVASMEDLGKMAERFQTVILHTESEQAHEYFVQSGEVLYRFMINRLKTETGTAATEAEGKS